MEYCWVSVVLLLSRRCLMIAARAKSFSLDVVDWRCLHFLLPCVQVVEPADLARFRQSPYYFFSSGFFYSAPYFFISSLKVYNDVSATASHAVGNAGIQSLLSFPQKENPPPKRKAPLPPAPRPPPGSRRLERQTTKHTTRAQTRTTRSRARPRFLPQASCTSTRRPTWTRRGTEYRGPTALPP